MTENKNLKDMLIEAVFYSGYIGDDCDWHCDNEEGMNKAIEQTLKKFSIMLNGKRKSIPMKLVGNTGLYIQNEERNNTITEIQDLLFNKEKDKKNI